MRRFPVLIPMWPTTLSMCSIAKFSPDFATTEMLPKHAGQHWPKTYQ